MVRRITITGGALALVLALLPVSATAEPKPYPDEAAINVAISHPADLSPAESPALSPRDVPAEPFAARYRMRPDGPLWTKWSTVMADIDRERRDLADCRNPGAECMSDAARRFNAIAETARAKDGRARIGEINRAVNLSIRAQDDLAQHGIIDRWTSPLATFAAGRGDCEDYAIAKLALLREVGVSGQDLRFVIVAEKRNPREHHAVAAVRHEGRWLVLDNRTLTLADAAELDADPLFVLRGPEPAPVAEPAPPETTASAGSDLPLLI